MMNIFCPFKFSKNNLLFFVGSSFSSSSVPFLGFGFRASNNAPLNPVNMDMVSSSRSRRVLLSASLTRLLVAVFFLYFFCSALYAA